MMDQGLLTDLSLSVGHRVTCEYSEIQGFWYIVERSTGVRGVPAHVKFVDMLERFPSSADGLYLPIGMGANRKPIYWSAGSFYHAIIGGATGSGKSVLINSWIVTLVRRNVPGKLQMLMIDLKGGVEFQSYEGIPHLLTDIPGVPTGIVNRREDVVGALRHVYNIGEARLNTLRETGHRDIGRYNAHRRSAPMSHIFVIADELADLMMDRDIKRDAEELIANMAARHRAAGIHLILCTQMPKVEVITGRIKANCPLRVALSCATNVASMVIIDNGNAHNLAPKGRAIAQFIQEVEVQTPLITDQIINDTVAGAIDSQYQELEAKHDVTRLEVLNWALSNNDGRLTVRTLYQQFASRGITVEELSTWLEEMENQTIIVGATEYLITPGRGSAPRKMVPVQENSQENPAEQQSWDN
jgi:DNA segregation ATPase FtsK/SpoIIIE-like protein